MRSLGKLTFDMDFIYDAVNEKIFRDKIGGRMVENSTRIFSKMKRVRNSPYATGEIIVEVEFLK